MLEKLSHVVVIVVGLICISVLVRNNFVPAPAAGPPNSVLVPGRRISGKGISQKGVTVVLQLSSHCMYCERSLPFYRQLSSWRHGESGFRVVAVGSESPDELKHYLQSAKIEVDDVESLPALLSVGSTPTLIVLQDGSIAKAWVGFLESDRRSQVADTLGRLCPKCRINS
jgi:thiol-disulfide isomerase/thioredoxin